MNNRRSRAPSGVLAARFVALIAAQLLLALRNDGAALAG